MANRELFKEAHRLIKKCKIQGDKYCRFSLGLKLAKRIEKAKKVIIKYRQAKEVLQVEFMANNKCKFLIDTVRGFEVGMIDGKSIKAKVIGDSLSDAFLKFVKLE